MKKIIISLLGLVLTCNSMAQSSTDVGSQKEFMFFIYSDGNRVTDLTSEKQQLHIQKIGAYIGNLAQSGKLKNAQPLDMEGFVISSTKGKFSNNALQKEGKVIAGYYHILAKDMSEAVAIAKADPRFEEDGWEIEVRPIKKIEGIN